MVTVAKYNHINNITIIQTINHSSFNPELLKLPFAYPFGELSRRCQTDIPSKLLKKSNTSQDKQYSPFSLFPFIILVRFSIPPPLPPLQLFAFIICLYSVSMHFTLPRARARKHRRMG